MTEPIALLAALETDVATTLATSPGTRAGDYRAALVALYTRLETIARQISTESDSATLGSARTAVLALDRELRAAIELA